jgi:hypothetical protein
MADRLLVIALLVSSLLNTALLLVLCIVLLRFLSTLSGLLKEWEGVIKRGEREVLATISSVRRSVNLVSLALDKGTQLMEKYMFVMTWRQLSTGHRWSRLLAAIGLGYGAIRAIQGHGAKRPPRSREPG